MHERIEKRGTRGALILVIFLFAGIFHAFLTGRSVLMSTDAIVSYANRGFDDVVREAVAYWDDGVLLGLPRGSWTQLAVLLQAVLPSLIWNNLVYGFACLVASLLLIFGYRRTIHPWAIAFAAVVAFWLGSNFTLVYAGHNLKPYVVMLFVASILAAGARTWRGGIIWGGITGLMFAQQPDVALFFALVGGSYLVFRLWRRDGLKPLAWLRVLLPALATALLFAAGPLISGYKLNVKGTAAMQTEDPREKWNYVPQWSFPPDEMISMVAPGYHGWRSGEPSGPYWGRTGQSPDWPETRQGFMNFMMESAYLGILPFAFMLYALLWGRHSPHRPEILFWSIAALVALLLSFGRHFPLYVLFYQLPLVNNIRNPNKFLQIFQVAVALSAMFGLDQFLRSAARDPEQKANAPRRPASFFWTVVGVAILLLLAAFGAAMNQPGAAAGFARQGWSAEAARVIAANQSMALWHASFMVVILAAVTALLTLPRFEKFRAYGNRIGAALAVIVAVDAWWLSRHYVQAIPRSYIEANPLSEFLKDNVDHHRVALLTQQGVYNIWLTYLLPYQTIPAFNLTQMPRMPQDYQTFLETGSRNPLRMWRFSAVHHLLGPSAFARQLEGEASVVFTYNIQQQPDGNLRVVAEPGGEHAVFALRDSLPRFAFLELNDPEDGPAAMDRLAGNGPLAGGPSAGTVELINYVAGDIHLRVRADRDGWLRVAERWDEDWTAEVNGSKTAVEKIDFLCLGLPLPAGEHEVILRYRPTRVFFYAQGLGWILMLAAAVASRKQTDEKT
jgi:hypothetical protein